MGTQDSARPSVTGYLIVLVGVAGWVVGCFLPLYNFSVGPNISLYRQITFGSIWSDIGGLLYLFGAIFAIFAISILGVIGMLRAGTRFLLVGAVIAWSLVSIGVLISLTSFVDVNPGATLDIGYWCCWASVIVVILGTAVMLGADRRRNTESSGIVPPTEAR